MPGDYRNIYKNARAVAAITQEAAAERLCISVESVRAYETGQRIPPNHAVSRMVTVYNTQWLAVQHVNLHDELAASIIPMIQPRTRMEAAIRFANRVNRFIKKHSLERLLEITEDNQVDHEEKEDYNEIVEAMGDLAQSYLELRFCDE